MLKSTSVLVLCMLLAACAGREPLQSTSDFTVMRGQAVLPAPSRTDLTTPDRPSLIGPLDTIEVNVFNVPDMTREVQVDASGRIALPLIGTIDAGGSTAEELANDIKRSLRGKYVRDPDVTVNIRKSVSQVVTVDGEVKQPGLYPITNQMTLLRAIASAQGLTEFARKNDVVVMRTVGGQRMAGLYSLEAIRRGVYPDPPIYSNDIVLVGDSPQRRMFKDLVSVAPLLAAPIIAILQRN